MIRQVTVDGSSVKDVAHSHSLKPVMISKLISRAKKDKNHINMMIEKQEEYINNRQLVIEAVNHIIMDGGQIASAKQLRLYLQEHN